MNAMHLNRQTIAQAAGGDLVTEIFEFDDATTIDAVEKLITDGCKGIFVTPTSNDVLYNVTDMCDEAGVYFIISMRSITDEEVKSYVENSKYYLGCVYEDEYQAGYMLGKALADSGAKDYCLITTASGSDMQGIVRLGTQATGDQSAIAAKLEEYSDKDIKFVTIDTDENCISYIKDGTITATLGDLLIQDSIAAATVLTDAVTGKPISDDPVELALKYSVITDADELQAYFDYMAVEEPIYNKDEVKANLLGLDVAGLEDLCNNMTALSVKELHESR